MCNSRKSKKLNVRPLYRSCASVLQSSTKKDITSTNASMYVNSSCRHTAKPNTAFWKVKKAMLGKEYYQHIIIQHDYHDHSKDPPLMLQFESHHHQPQKHRCDHDDSDEGLVKGKVGEDCKCDDCIEVDSTKTELGQRYEIMKILTCSLKTFPMKLYDALEAIMKETPHKNIMSWQPHGRCFVIHDCEMFKSFILPHYFHLDIMTSFQRQLNLYGFKRITESNSKDRNGYYHEYFLRGRSDLLYKIQRTKIKGTWIRAKSNPGQEPNFWLDYPWMTSIQSHHEKTTYVAPATPKSMAASPYVVSPSPGESNEDFGSEEFIEQVADDTDSSQNQLSVRVNVDVKRAVVITPCRENNVRDNDYYQYSSEEIEYPHCDLLPEMPLLGKYIDFSMPIDDVIVSSAICDDKTNVEVGLSSSDTQISTTPISSLSSSMTIPALFPRNLENENLYNISNQRIGQSESNHGKIDFNHILNRQRDIPQDCPAMVKYDNNHCNKVEYDDYLSPTAGIDECFVPCCHQGNDPNDIVLMGWGKPFHYLESFCDQNCMKPL